MLHRLDRGGARRSWRGCAQQIKRVTLELGGKSANIVFADADLELAAARAPSGVFDNAGQDCCARSRILVERAVYERFMALLEPAVAGVAVGDPTLEATEMGPLISEAHLDTRGVVRARRRSGGRPRGVPRRARATGSPRRCWHRSTPATGRPPRRSSDRWWSSSPSRTRPTPSGWPTTRPTGCPGSLWTRDVGRALRVARAVETGTLSVNSHSSVRYWTPFGGVKQSGIGRELGPDALDAFSDVKNVFISSD